MPATPLVSSLRYYRPGVSEITWVPSIANKAAPTRAELDAGTDLSGEVASVSGWTVTSNFIDTPDLNSTFVSKIPGSRTAEDSTLNLYASSNSTDARSLLVRGTAGFVVIFYEGDIASRRMNVFPVVVASAPQEVNVDNAAQLVVSFSISSEPAENVTVPA